MGTSFLNYPYVEAAAKAAVNGINDSGGVNGRPLQYVFCNGMNDPNAEAACAREMVSDHVVATVKDLASASSSSVTSILGAADISELAVSLYSASQFVAPNAFPLDGGFTYEFAALLEYTKMHGLNRVVLATVSSSGASGLTSLITGAAKAVGVDLVGETQIPETASVYSSYAEAVITDHPDVVLTALADNQIVGLMNAVRQLGGTNIKFFDNVGGLSGSDFSKLGSAASSQVVLAVPTPPISATAEFPLLKTFDQWLGAEKAAGDGSVELQNTDGEALEAMQMVVAFVDIAKTLPNITAQSFLAAATKANNVQIGLVPAWSPDIKGPPNFTRVSNSYEYYWEVQNGNEVLATPQPYNAAPLVRAMLSGG